jgi:predicted nicotinamide N-methyase
MRFSDHKVTTPARLRYQTVEFDNTDIHLCTLRDLQEFYDPNGIAERLGIGSAVWSMFGVLWPSSLVLGHYISDYDTAGKRILEVGCGIALSSLLLNTQNEDITATDHHPETGLFLNRNALLNNSEIINYERTGWLEKTDKLGNFDLIIGSDLLYEDQHIKLLSNFIERHANASCEVILVDPGRGHKNKFSMQMENYGFSNSQIVPIHTKYLNAPFKGRILKYVRH